MSRSNRKGDYYSPLPIDFTILELMPEKGMIGGVHWKGRRATDLRNDIIEQLRLAGVNGDVNELVRPAAVAARLRSMNVVGLVEAFAAIGTSGVQIWARTEKGTEFLATKEEVLGA